MRYRPAWGTFLDPNVYVVLTTAGHGLRVCTACPTTGNKTRDSDQHRRVAIVPHLSHLF